MVDSREKGARGETVARDALRKLTGLKWERTPGSGALDPKHNLKGDLYVPNANNAYATEMKHYKDDQVSTSLLSGKSPILLGWWEQALRQAIQVKKLPLLIFKHDRSKLFAAYLDMPMADYKHMAISVPPHEFYISLLEDWILNNNPKFIIT